MGREITPAECGENRISHYSCPETCPFNPFTAANYDTLLETEDTLDALTMVRLKADPGRAEAYRSASMEGVRKSPAHGMHAVAVWHLFFVRDASGRTFGQQWEQDGFRELRNDARVLFRAKMQMRVALLEVHHLIDAERFTAIDLLNPEAGPLLFVDRSLAATASRFTTLLAWTFPMPHFWRMSGTAIGMNDLGPFSAREAIDACVAHLGGPAELGPKREWLARNFVDVDRAVNATASERRRQMFAALDARVGTLTYDLQSSATECVRLLTATREVERQDPDHAERREGFEHAFDWFESPAASGAGRPVLGRVLVGRKSARVSAFGGERLKRLRAAFEARLGDRVRFSKERIDDLGGRIAAGDPPADLTLVPPRLLENPGRLEMASSRMEVPPSGASRRETEATFRQRLRQDWVDEPVPGLDGRTPRQASGEAPLRPRLLEMMKAQVRDLDRQNLATGRSDDINGLIRELGLSEIDVPPPPKRAPQADGDEFEDEEFAEAGEDAPALFRPAPPRLPRKALSFAKASDRLDKAIAPFDTAAAAMRELEASGSSVLADLDALTDGMLTETEFSLLITHVLRVWFALVPPGSCAPDVDFEKIGAGLDHFTRASRADLLSGPMATLLDDCRQPNLLKIAFAGLMEMEKMPGAKPFSPQATMTCAIVLRFLIDALDEAIGRE